MSQVIPPLYRRHWAAAAALSAALVGSVAAQTSQPGAGIYTCIDAQGRRITSDRPIRECQDREQAELNRDGSVRRKLPPNMTAEERVAYDEAQRRKLAEDSAHKDMVRLDRNLLMRYPTEADHVSAREAALASARKLLSNSQTRLADLQRDRTQLDNEAEFYKGRELPRQLKSQYDANQASADAQRSLIQNHQAELQRLNSVYDEELARLKKLWAGAPPGAAAAASSRGTTSAR
jgi:hypothetical protein